MFSSPLESPGSDLDDTTASRNNVSGIIPFASEDMPVGHYDESSGNVSRSHYVYTQLFIHYEFNNVFFLFLLAGLRFNVLHVQFSIRKQVIQYGMQQY